MKAAVEFLVTVKKEVLAVEEDMLKRLEAVLADVEEDAVLENAEVDEAEEFEQETETEDEVDRVEADVMVTLKECLYLDNTGTLTTSAVG